MLINALLVPILVFATLIALYIMDRDLSWLKRLRPLIGIPLAIAIASPWLLVRAHQDGTAFAGMSWREFLGALGGAQDMKLRAFPGTFALALLVRLPSRHRTARHGIQALMGVAQQETCTVSAGLGDRLSRLSRSAVVEARHLHGADDVSGAGARRCYRGRA